MGHILRSTERISSCKNVGPTLAMHVCKTLVDGTCNRSRSHSEMTEFTNEDDG